MEEKYILSIDSGGRSIRAFLFDKKGEIKFRESIKTPSYSNEPGAQEHDPQFLFEALVKVVKKVLKTAKCKASDVQAMGISVQRGNFVLWEKDTGKPVSPLISWADVRAHKVEGEMNKNTKWRIVKNSCKVISKIVPDPSLAAAAMLNYTTDHASVRLKWFFQKHPEIEKRCFDGEIYFGTLDTWFLYNLNADRRHVTDTTNAMGSSFFNPAKVDWNDIVFKIFNIPKKIMPKVLSSNGDFGVTDKKIFGAEIPIRAVLGDQMASLFGHCAFTPGDVKISQGSGAFVDLNVGKKPKTSKRGLFPLIAWTIDDETTYMLEGYVATAGTLIDWLGSGIGLSGSGPELDKFAEECEKTDGVIVIPTASGIRFPYFNPNARASILGLSLATHRSHVARAVLEGIAFRMIDIVKGMKLDTKTDIVSIKVDGGLSKSDILTQSLADYTGKIVERAAEADTASIGAAFMAGLGSGYWKDLEEIKSLQNDYTTFKPKIEEEERKRKLEKWERVVRHVNKIVN